MALLCLVELQRPTDRIEHVVRHSARIAALKARVVLGADARQKRDLLTSEAGNSSLTTVPRQARAFGRKSRPSRCQEFADLV